MFDLAAILGSVAVGASAYAGVRYAAPKLDEGLAQSPSLIRSSRGEGRTYNVAGGAFCWDRRFEEGPPDIMRDPLGRTARWGTRAAADMAAGLVNIWLSVGNRWYALANRGISAQATERAMRGRATNGGMGAYDLGSCSRSEKDLLARMVDAQCKCATALRILARACQAAGLNANALPILDRLRRIKFYGQWNAMSLVQGGNVGMDRWATVQTDPSAWELIGVAWLAELSRCWPEFMHPGTSNDQFALQRDLEPYLRAAGLQSSLATPNVANTSPTPMKGTELAPAPSVTMGITFLGAIVVVIVAVIAGTVVYEALSKGVTAVATYLGYDAEYHQMLLDQWEIETERCRQGDQGACARAAALDQRIRGMTSPITLIGRMAGLGVGLAGGVIVFWLIKKGWQKGKARVSNPQQPQLPDANEPQVPPPQPLQLPRAVAPRQLPSPAPDRRY